MRTRRLLRGRPDSAGRAATVEDPAPPPAAAVSSGGHQVVEGSYTRIDLDYPVEPVPRWGHGRPSHPRLTEILEGRRERYRVHLDAIIEVSGPLRRISVDPPSDPGAPHWVNGWLPALDGATLSMFLATTDPPTYMEIGSGNSTKFARRAIADHGLRTRIVSIDPFPRAEVDALCDEVVREPAESVDVAVFDRLVPGDVLFVDNSHRCLQNSDATAIFLDVLPRLPPGILVEFHDIFLPDDYPSEWAERFYSEQYVLAAFLLAGGPLIETELPAWYVANDPELSAVIEPLWDEIGLTRDRHGGSFWVRTGSARSGPP